MNRTNSKYFATATRMDEAFLELLKKKDLAYITVKEICQKAKVNRSTFYLHYETINDLLNESVEHITQQFVTYMAKDTEAFIKKIRTCPKEELYVVTPEYLKPYLAYIKEHRRLFCTVMANAQMFRLTEIYERLFQHVFRPILERFGVPKQDMIYIIAFYVHGLMAIITEWLQDDCTDSIEHVIAVIQQCVIPH